jgi:hypothetical protein
MPEADFNLRQGDTSSLLARTLRDELADPVDLEGASVRFHMTSIAGGEPKVDEAAANEQVGNGSDGSKGKVEYAWQADDTDTPGLFLGEFQVTFANGKVQTFPNNRYLLIRITAQLA